MSRFFSSRHASLVPYTPGEQPKVLNVTKLNTNECPFPPSAKALRFAAENTRPLNLYPELQFVDIRGRLAGLYGISPDNFVLGNGSDELLNFAFMAFCDDQKQAAFPNISYGFYPVYAELNHVPYLEIPLREDFSIAPEDYFNLGRTIFIANPNAPTGMALTRAQVDEIVKRNPDSVVVIDEAYVDFGGETCIPLIQKYDNLLVIQTFSKSRSMAGARLGFAAGSEALIKENCRAIMENRAWTVAELESLGFTVLPSSANFIFARSGRIDGGELYAKLKARNILIRHFDKPEISAWNRITIGTREQMDILLRNIREILEEKP